MALLTDATFWTALGSVATAAAFIAVLYQIVSTDRRQTSADERAQAELVSGWIDADPGRVATFVLSNASQTPVYEVVAVVVATRSGPATAETAIVEGADTVVQDALPPGRVTQPVRSYPGSGPHASWTVEVGFTDAGGRHWMRRQDGSLERLSMSAWFVLGVAPGMHGIPSPTP